MGLKSKLDSLDGIDESLRALYVERDGKFYLDIEDDGRQRALEHERSQRAEATRKVAELEAKLRELESKPPAETRQEQKQDDDRIAALTKQIEGLTKKLEAADEQARKAKLDAVETRHFDEVRRAALAAGVREELVDDFITARVRSLYKLDEKSERFVPLNPADRESVLYGDEYATKPATHEQLIKAVLADKAASLYLKPSGGPDLASGTRGATGSGVVLSASDARDPVKFRMAKEAAAKAGAEVIIQ